MSMTAVEAELSPLGVYAVVMGRADVHMDMPDAMPGAMPGRPAKLRGGVCSEAPSALSWQDLMVRGTR